jgi:hypothetical protein
MAGRRVNVLECKTVLNFESARRLRHRPRHTWARAGLTQHQISTTSSPANVIRDPRECASGTRSEHAGHR